MKQFESHGVTFFHNSDFSGDIHMQHARGPGFVVPASALKALALEIIREHNESQKKAEMLLIASIAAEKLRGMLGVEVNAQQFLAACQAADKKAESLLGEIKNSGRYQCSKAYSFDDVRCESIDGGPMGSDKRCVHVRGHGGGCQF